MNEKEYLSQEKFEQLQVELKKLKMEDRQAVAEQLEFAKSLGDLSENAEYHEARDKQADIEDRILTIEDILKNAVIISKQHGSQVSVGSAIVVKKDNGEAKEYSLVGPEETDVTNGKISYQSPLGAALMGRSRGEVVEVQTPKGIIKYSIVEVK